MAITPSDIEKKTFSTALRGYDLDEVDDFLDEMVVTVRELQEELTRARQRVDELESDPDALAAAPAMTAGPDESAVGRALVAAQQAADRMLEEARSEADKIVGDARSEADTYTRERDERKAEVDAEMAEMTGLVARVRTQLAVLATTVADKLDEMDAAVAGAHSMGAAMAPDTEEPDDGGSPVEESLDDLVDETLGDVAGETESLEVEGDGLEVDPESLDTSEEDAGAGSAEIEGVDADEEAQEI
ncbi:MAG: DivIVA domain-containing protein [Acidimicrobiia bacterium]